jgi:hypothetical protein
VSKYSKVYDDLRPEVIFQKCTEKNLNNAEKVFLGDLTFSSELFLIILQI